MNRRGFLKSIVAVLAGCALAPSVAKADGFKRVNRLSDREAARIVSREHIDALTHQENKWVIEWGKEGFLIFRNT